MIPSFSLHYITECREYLDYSGDREFLREIWPKLVSVAEAFTGRMEEGHSIKERHSMEKAIFMAEKRPRILLKIIEERMNLWKRTL